MLGWVQSAINRLLTYAHWNREASNSFPISNGGTYEWVQAVEPALDPEDPPTPLEEPAWLAFDPDNGGYKHVYHDKTVLTDSMPYIDGGQAKILYPSASGTEFVTSVDGEISFGTIQEGEVLPDGDVGDIMVHDGAEWSIIDASAVSDYSIMVRWAAALSGWNFQTPTNTDSDKYYFLRFNDSSTPASKGYQWVEVSTGSSVPDGTDTGDMLYWDETAEEWKELDASAAAQYEVLQMGASSIPVWDELRAT